MLKYTKLNRIKLWWSKNRGVSNFGDELNPYLVEKISTKKVKRVAKIPRFSFTKTNLVIGSVVQISNRYCNVWGAGIIEKNANIRGGVFYAVRGPLTRNRIIQLGLKCPKIYGDPALLLPLYFKDEEVSSKFEIGVIPHVIDFQLVDHLIKDDRVKVIDLTEPVEVVLRNILSCKKIVSSSLHGIIVPQAYNIPSVWVTISNKLYGDNIKFADYFASVGISDYLPDALDFSKPTVSFEELNNVFKKHANNALIKADLNKIQQNLLNSCPFN